MDQSLDEIIKRNKMNNRRRKRPVQANTKKEAASPVKKRVPLKRTAGAAPRAAASRAAASRGVATVKGGNVKKKKVTDLRLLIGGKPAARSAGPLVRDAREKLSKVSRVPDARDKLVSRASMSVDMMMRRARRSSAGGQRRKLETSRKPAYMDLEEARIKGRSGGSSLLYRTLDNSMHYLGDYGHMVPTMSRPLHLLATSNRSAPSPLMPDSWMQPSIQDITRFQPLTRTFNNQDDVWAQPQIPRRSNGVSAKRRLDRDEEMGHTQGYRIVVSNLQPSVTHEDIKELFEDIGSLYSSRVVRPGTAEVVYKNMEDAVKAVDTYHNRQLDGQPMKCLLVKPSNMSRILSKGSVIPDLHAIRKALFNK